MQVAVGAPDRPEKGEDWEHEEERQDDDLEQGEEEGSDHDLNVTTKKCDAQLYRWTMKFLAKCTTYLQGYYFIKPSFGQSRQ